MNTEIEINEKFREAIEAIGSGKNVFVTGKAGTGKSTLLTYIRNIVFPGSVVLAPTGVAAVNVRGQTIHSFFGFRPDITVDKVRKKYRNIRNAELFKKLSMIIIDEISMVRADLLDCVDSFLQMHGPKKRMAFGGVQMVMIGDLYQLPPVVTGGEREIFKTFYQSPYFFDSLAFSHLPIELIELEKIYRQKDESFIRILNGIRNRSIGDDLLGFLNQRVDATFVPPQGSMYLSLVTTNEHAQRLNEEALGRLPGRQYCFEGELTGEFDQKALPAPLHLEVKNGAQVMLTNNDKLGRWINGTIGKITKIKRTDTGDSVFVELETGETVDVWPYTWDMYRFSYNRTSGRIDSETIGSFTQYPLLLAWSVTIHKSQGKTFDWVVIDMGRGAFAHGQTYVALSRATTLQGIVLTKPIEKRHILLDWRIVKFLTGYQYKKSEAILPLAKKIQLLESAKARRIPVEIVYLKSGDEKSRRHILPKEIGTMEYLGKEFLGVSAFDELRGEERVFRVDRILSIDAIL